MIEDPRPRIVEAEQLDNGVLVRFGDDRTAIYPALLLYSAIELSEVMNEAEVQKENP